MEVRRRCYVSRCYPHNLEGGFKAKLDIEAIMEENNFYNLGLKQKTNKNKIVSFFYNLISIIKAILTLRKNDLLVIQYPLKKYYYFLSYAARLKQAKVITLVHDLGCFRRKKITIEQEKKRFSKTDHLIVLSNRMKDFIIEQGYEQSVSVLHLWDYLNTTKPKQREFPTSDKISVLYVGDLSKNKHGFMYKFDETISKTSLYFAIYGRSFDKNIIKNKEHFTYHGVKDSSLIIKQTNAHYGLLWYSTELKGISGAYGEYLKYNTSHKISLYLHAHLPIIVWSEASFAEFTRKHAIGICVDTLEDLDKTLESISEKDYLQMVENTRVLSKEIAKGTYFMNAYLEGEKQL